MDRCDDRRVVAFVQARLSSSRFPGKVLAPFGGDVLLGVLLDRLGRGSSFAEIVVTTSTESSDDPVAAFCASRGTACFRGPLDDVLGRVVGAAIAHDAGVVVRVSGDSPLIDPAIVDRVVAAFDEGCDLATNVFPRTFPPGQSVEVVAGRVLAAAADEIDDPSDREHVTPWFYRSADRFRVRNVALEPALRQPSFVVDTSDDLARLERLLAAAGPNALELGLPELVAALPPEVGG